MVVYLDDIIVYNRTLEENAEHLRTIFSLLCLNESYVKFEKCTFVKEEILFLGHWISGGQIYINQEKVQTIRDWHVPKLV